MCAPTFSSAFRCPRANGIIQTARRRSERAALRINCALIDELTCLCILWVCFGFLFDPQVRPFGLTHTGTQAVSKKTNRTTMIVGNLMKIKKLFRREKSEELPPLPGFAPVCVCCGVRFGLPLLRQSGPPRMKCTLCRILIFTFHQGGSFPIKRNGIYLAGAQIKFVDNNLHQRCSRNRKKQSQ